MPRMPGDRERQDAHDALLTWCSETGSGTTRAFGDACRALGLPVSGAARVLSALGHVEFGWDTGRYAAAPTVLTTIPGLAGRMLLTGARPYGLIAHLAQTAESAELDVEVSREPHHQFGAGPSTVLIDGDPADGAAFAAAADIDFCPQAHLDIAAVLPEVSVDGGAGVPHRPDTRFPHALIDPHTLRPRWDAAEPDHTEGLWLYRTWGDRQQMILRTPGESLLLADRDYGPYMLERPTDADPIVEYRPAHWILVVNAAAPLPHLHARAASLCSGRVPIRRHAAPGVAHDHYVNVDPDTAGRILTSLGATP
jgi:hypothetical protein